MNPFPGRTALYKALSKRTIITLVGPIFFLVNVSPPECPHILKRETLEFFFYLFFCNFHNQTDGAWHTFDTINLTIKLDLCMVVRSTLWVKHHER